MKGVRLSMYVYELQKHRGVLLYEWLLEVAKKIGIQGGSIFRAIGGYGHHGVLHEERFFELASNVPVEVVFLLEKEQSDQLLKKILEEEIHVTYSVSEIEFGTLP